MIPVVQDMMLDKRVYYGAAILAVVLLLSGGWLGYRWYRVSQERAAYKELAESIDAYSRITTLADAEDQLMDSDRAFLAGAEAHRSSVLYPFFLAFQADTLIRLGKVVEAAKQLDKAVKAMDPQHPLYFLYAIKAALVKIDTKDATQEKEGRAMLATLASNVANPLQDMALYYSGLDADTQGEQSQAASKYKEIIAHGKKESYWYQLADAKLKAGD